MADRWLEKDLEDAIEENFDALCDLLEVNLKYIGRQIKCVHGIIDMLFYSGPTIYVVELKAEKAADRAVGQVYRYKRAILETNPYKSAPSSLKRLAPDTAMNIRTVIIAPSFSNSAVHAADHSIVARRKGDGFVIGHAPYDFDNRKDGADALGEILKPYHISIFESQAQQNKRRAELIAEHSPSRRISNTN